MIYNAFVFEERKGRMYIYLCKLKKQTLIKLYHLCEEKKQIEQWKKDLLSNVFFTYN